ncbi:hypothetical protein GVAV_002616 [Gurleya vavrai]
MYKSKIELKKIILLIYEFSANTNVKNTAFEYNLDSSTVSRYFNKFREITINHYKRNQPLQIGGDGVIVEWDECLLVKNKNHTGRILAGQKFIFGGVEKNNPSLVFLEHLQTDPQLL